MRRVEPVQGCSCKNSRCLKLYCECFGNGKFCDPLVCRCGACQNDPGFPAERTAAMRLALERNPSAFQPKITSGNKVDVHLKVGTRSRRDALARSQAASRNTASASRLESSAESTAAAPNGRRSPLFSKNIVANLSAIQKMHSIIDATRSPVAPSRQAPSSHARPFPLSDDSADAPPSSHQPSHASPVPVVIPRRLLALPRASASRA